MSRLLAYLRHLTQSTSIYSVHSPFVFDFFRKVLRHRSTPEGAAIEAARRTLSRSSEELEIVDYGAGADGEIQLTRKLSVSDAAKKSARHRREGELLYRLCRHYQPKRCLELGTNLGISTRYQLVGLQESRFLSLEGDPGLARIAQEQLNDAGLHAEILVGEFSDLLATKIDLAEYRPDYVFLDGNHREEPTLHYFHHILPHLPDGAILVLDDINWSPGMKRAWDKICQHPEVTVSIDLFWMGICFIRKNQVKEHFQFRFRNR